MSTRLLRTKIYANVLVVVFLSLNSVRVLSVKIVIACTLPLEEKRTDNDNLSKLKTIISISIDSGYLLKVYYYRKMSVFLFTFQQHPKLMF